MEVRDAHPTPEEGLAAREAEDRFSAALAALPAEDAAIIRLRYVQGLSLNDVRRALHLNTLTQARIGAIIERLRQLVSSTLENGGRAAVELADHDTPAR